MAVALLSGCQSHPERFDRYARQLGMERHLVEGLGFRHILYTKPGNTPQALHVYLAGDGRPWLKGLWPADDPSPGRALALDLMAQDAASALLLGRPCYHGLSDDEGCSSHYWTSARYSPAVVDSMVGALKNYLDGRNIRELTLIGYSGGGSLAVLMAPAFPEVTRVITIAANLDIATWADHHGYLPLSESLNPISAARLGHIPHRHLAGANDSTVPPAIIEAFAERHGGMVELLPDFDHRCCWREAWPQLLGQALNVTENRNTHEPQ